MLQHQMLASYQHIVILLQLQSSDTVISSYLFSTGRSWMMCWEIPPPPRYLVVLFCLDSLVLDGRAEEQSGRQRLQQCSGKQP